MKRAAAAVAAACAMCLAGPAHADADTDFADQLHGYGIYGARDYNAWLAKITCERLRSRRDATAAEAVQFLSASLPRHTSPGQTWEFLATAIGFYCPDHASVLNRQPGRAGRGVG